MTGFSQIFWGLLLVFLDIRLDHFDILPDLVGFILAYSGFSQLSHLHTHFTKAKYAVIPLLLLSILDLFNIQAQFSFSTSGASSLSLSIVALTIAATVMYLYMIYHLCKGIGYVARQAGSKQLEQKAEMRWQSYLWITVVTAIVPILALLGAASGLLILFIPLAIIGLIVYVLILLLIRETDQIWGSTSLHD